MNPETAPVVCAEPEDGARAETVEALADAGLEPAEASTVEELQQALTPATDCVVTAASFPDGDAFDVVDIARKTNPECTVVIHTDRSPSDLPRGSHEQVVEFIPRSVSTATDRIVEIAETATTELFQAAFPMPRNEQERLAAVESYDVDELGALDTFDRITALMSNHFDIDVAFVGLVDEHEERFVACEGANWQTLDREDSICTHTILSDDVMIVEDTDEDPRFAANDRLDELDIQSYAGVRLTDEDGSAIGAVCCIDDERRSYSRTELDDLQRFAAEVEEQLQLRQRLREADR